MSAPQSGAGAEQALAANEWAAISAHRADLYAWFSTLFAAELSNEAVAAYRRGDAEPLLAALEGLSLAQEVQRLRRALDAWGTLPFLRVELAADFARLFLLDARDAAVPYASAYLDPKHELYGEPHMKMQAFLRESGLQVRSAFKEPSDHLAVFLAYIEAWVRGTATADAKARPHVAADQASFLKEALLSWLPQVVERCERIRKDTASDFYPAIAALLLAFVSEDAASLEAAGALP